MSKPKTDKKIDIPESILRQLLTVSELRMLKNRWHIIQLLEEGLSIRKVAERARVGTDTVVRVARMVEKGTVQKILDKDRSARNKLPFKTKTPWIFGKSNE